MYTALLLSGTNMKDLENNQLALRKKDANQLLNSIEDQQTLHLGTLFQAVDDPLFLCIISDTNICLCLLDCTIIFWSM